MTSRGVRSVRVISRMDCWAKIGAKSDLLAAATWPGVARPRRSPNPNDFFSPRTVGVVRMFTKVSEARCARASRFLDTLLKGNAEHSSRHLKIGVPGDEQFWFVFPRQDPRDQ